MDFDGDGEFGAQDATILGGVMGFAEESIREENKDFDNELDEDTIDMIDKQMKEPNLRLIYNMNPKLFKFIAKRVVEQQKRWREQRLLREAEERGLNDNEFSYELDAMEKTEMFTKNES